MDAPGSVNSQQRIRIISRGAAPIQFVPEQIEERMKRPPTPGTIRLFDPPIKSTPFYESLWYKDLSLREWINHIDTLELDAAMNTISSCIYPEGYAAKVRAIFESTQRQRWLARMVLQRWTQRVWGRRTQCDVDLIGLEPVSDKDAVFLTDTRHHTIFRFHRRDIFKNILANICLSDEMLPTPRYPTNPWTNERLTLGQTIGICQQLAADFGRRGVCPPMLFAAFWASRFNLKRFRNENSGILSQNAVTSYFKDLHQGNRGVVLDTMTNLMSEAGLNYSRAALSRWLTETPLTPIHREWLELARDYTLYMNLHVQVRPNWYTESLIYADVRALYSRTTIPEIVSQRLNLLHGNTINNVIPIPPTMFGLYTLPAILQQTTENDTLTYQWALNLIQNSLNHQ